MANRVIAGLEVFLSANNAQLKKALAETSTGFTALSKQTRNLQSVLGGLGIGIGLFQVGRFVQSAIGTFAEFEQKMSEVKAITNATASEFKKLETDAIRLGRSTVFTAREVAGLQVAYGRLGFSTKEIIAATEATLNLAAATNTDLASAADVAGSTVRAFQLDASETGRVTDVMASSFNKSALAIDSFRESMKFVAPVANAAGASIEETTALLGVLANNGLRGSLAGTALRRIFSDLTKDGRPLIDRLRELGEKGLTLSEAFDEIGRVSQTALLVLSNNVSAIEKLSATLELAAGEAERVANVRLDNLQGDVIRLTSAWEGFLLASQNSSIYRKFITDLTYAVNFLGGELNQIPTILSQIGTQLQRQEQKGFSNLFGLNAQNNINGFLEELRKVVELTGKPINEGLVESIVSRFNLGLNTADKFRAQIAALNKEITGFTGTSLDVFIRLNTQLEVLKQRYADLPITTTSERSKALADEILNLEEKIKNLTNVKVETFFDKFSSAIKKTADPYVFGTIADGFARLKTNVEVVIDNFKRFGKDGEASLNQLREAKQQLIKQSDEVKAKDIEQATRIGEQIRLISAEIERLEALRNKVKEVKTDVAKNPIVIPVELSFGNFFSDNEKNLVDDILKRFNARIAETANSGTIPILQSQIKNLQDAISKSFNADEIRGFQSEIDRLNESIATLSGTSQQLGLVWAQNGKIFFNLKQIIQNFTQEAITSLSFAIGQFIGGLSKKEIFAGLLNNLAGMLSQLGQLAISTGVTIAGIKKAIQSLNPAVAIAAGVALLTLAGYVSSRARAIGSGGGGASSSISSGGGGSSFAFAQDSIGINLSAETIIRGQDLYVVLSNYDKNNRNTRNG
jgi:predicted  nucleic acid-binding Zn-ribbon protein